MTLEKLDAHAEPPAVLLGRALERIDALEQRITEIETRRELVVDRLVAREVEVRQPGCVPYAWLWAGEGGAALTVGCDDAKHPFGPAVCVSASTEDEEPRAVVRGSSYEGDPGWELVSHAPLPDEAPLSA